MRTIILLIAIIFGLSSCRNSEVKAQANESNSEVSKVYMTTEITPESLVRIYEALGREVSGKVGVKLHMGEPGGTNYLKPELVGEFVKSINGTFIDANTAYAGRRSTAAEHYKVAAEHGFSAIGAVDILDEEGEISLPIKGGTHLKEVLVGSHFDNYDFIVILTHFKGHAMGGFGGSLKNLSIGVASISGKCLIHTAGASSTNAFASVERDHFIESMAEGAKGMIDHVGQNNIIYINVMNNLSVDCDCDSNPAKALIEDVGIFASLDPVALDKACVDQVYSHPNPEKKHLEERIESRNGTHILTHAEKIGVGSQEYELIKIE